MIAKALAWLTGHLRGLFGVVAAAGVALAFVWRNRSRRAATQAARARREAAMAAHAAELARAASDAAVEASQEADAIHAEQVAVHEDLAARATADAAHGATPAGLADIWNEELHPPGDS